jgi:hypothetical protein
MRFYLFLFILFRSLQVYSWGFYAHGKINELAVFTVPKPLFGFYKKHCDYLTSHAADADKRRYMLVEEACRHYLDGDHYEVKAPFDTLPHQYKDACQIYGEDSLHAHGIVPWYINTVLFRLTEAFKEKDVPKILRLSADLGHYTGEAHVPLHSTSNYNGQKTGQKGIHALWESRLPELFSADYELLSGQAVYLEDPSEAIWKAFGESYRLVDSVLKVEKELSLNYNDGQKYSWESRGSQTVKVYSEVFCKAYHTALGNMVEERLNASISLLGSLWYTAWVNAGQPDMDAMETPQVPESNDVLPEKGKMLGRDEE